MRKIIIYILVGVTLFTIVEIDSTMKKTWFYFLLMLVLLSGCNQKDEIINWGGGMIEAPGTYYYPQSNLTLKVYLENGFVRYNLKDSLGGQLITYKENISTYQKWAFFIDENKRIGFDRFSILE